MAIVVPDVLPQPIQAPREQPSATLETFGGGAGLEAIGQEVRQGAKDVSDIATFEKIRADQTAVQDATSKLSEIHSDLLYNPKTGVLASRGINTPAAVDQGWKEYTRQANAIAATLHGQAQQGAFNKVALSMGDHFRQTGMAHEAQQYEVHDQNTFNSLVSNQTELAAKAYGNPSQIASSFGIINDNAVQRARRMGLGKDETEAFMLGIHSNFHENVIGQMVNDPKFAKVAPGEKVSVVQGYYDQNKDDMSEAARDRAEKVISVGTTKSEANQTVVDLMKKHPDSESDFLADADKIDDADQRALVRQIGSTQYSQNRAAVKNDQEQAANSAMDLAKKNNWTDPVDVRNNLPPTLVAKMSAPQLRAVMSWASNDPTSTKKWGDWMQAVKNGNVTSLSRHDLEVNYLQYFSQADRKQALETWVNGQKGSARLMDDQNVYKQIETDLVNGGLIHSDPKNRGTGDHNLLFQFQGDVHRDIVGFETGNNRSPKPDEIQKIIDHRTREYYSNNVVKVPVGPGSLFGTQKAISIMTDSEKGEAYVPYGKIPARDLQTLEALQRQASGRVTRSKAERMYASYLTGNAKQLRAIASE